MKQLSKILRIPGFGQAAIVLDPNGESTSFPGGISFGTRLSAQVIRNGRPILASEALKSSWLGRHRLRNERTIELGSGLVTNVGVMALANDFAWPQNCQTLKLANYHFFGLGSTAAAATDIGMETLSANGGQNAATGVQSFLSAANSQKYQTVATTAFTGTEAITEWGLFTDSTLSANAGSPFTASSATGATGTGAALTASSSSVRGQTQKILLPGTTSVYGLITSNTTSAFTVPAWYTRASGAVGATPGATEAYTIRPVLWDHKTFSAVNVIAGDSIQLTYQLTITSGG